MNGSNRRFSAGASATLPRLDAVSMRIFYHKAASENLVHLVALAKCIGISAELFDVQNSAIFAATMEDTMLLPGTALVLDVASLKEICRQDDLRRIAALIADRTVSVLLLTTEVDEPTDLFLRIVTGGVVLQSYHVGSASHINFPREESGLSGELSSHSYPRRPAKAIGFTLRPGTKADLIMTLEKSPSFVRIRARNASIFVWSSLRIFNVSRPLAAEKEFEDAADEYIPAIIFLRFAFDEQCWHNPNLGAGIVIDDPLLRKKYGFITFPQLLESARRHQYHVTLAFIPWNHWRSRAKELKLFRDHSDCFSICLHGCDHTNNEYGLTDYDVLLRKNFVARERMERHGHRTALRSEPLMVCPQERYSLEAMRAFSDSRQFFGLVCTACMPRNLASPQISAADLLLPAQDSFFGFPVFKRHYWNGMETFAMSLFLGKPAILVEHHEFFRNGSAGAEEFVRRLAEMRPGLKWTSLLQTVTSTHARRHVSEGRWEVRFFTDTFHFKHSLEEPIHYRLLRRIPEAAVIERVRVGGTDVPFLRENDFLNFEVHALHPQIVSVEVKIAPVTPTKAYSSGLKYQVSVGLRRGLSELRDNIAARNRFALGATRLLTKALKQTSR